MLCELGSKEEASVMGRVGAKAPAALDNPGGQEILLLPQRPTSLPLVCPGLCVETKLTPTSPLLFPTGHSVGDAVALED